MLTSPFGPAPTDALDFEKDVLDASHERPVLVDFWAAWCGPCRVLGPVLERLDAEERDRADRWRLVKVDTEAHPDLAAQFGIRGIPAVKLFVEGRVAAEFTGALPEPAVRQWLDEHLPSASKRALARAEARLAEGDREAARPLLESVLADEETGPTADAARFHLARLVVFTDPERAADLAADLPVPEAEGLRTLAALLRRDPDALPDAPVRDRYAAALAALQDDDVDAALDHFIAVVQRDRGYEDDGARKAVVAVFQTLGEADPVVKKHRPLFNRSLY